MGSKEKQQQLDPGDLNDDLVVEDEDKNWKGICIAFLVISTIISFIVIAIMILTPTDGPRITNARISLEDIISGHYKPEDFTGSWISDTQLLLKNKSDGSLVVFDAAENSTHILVSNTTMRQYGIQRYSMSADKKYVLLVHEMTRVYSNSYTAKYKIYNVSNEHVFPLEGPNGGQELQLALWGPKSSQILFIYQNNIYYMPSMDEGMIQLTSSGKSGLVFNGIPDWLYGEKILQSNSALWFSPLGSKLAFASFDDTKVASIEYPIYGVFDDPNNIYPEIASVKYPKAGKTNPEVTLYIVDLTSDEIASKNNRPGASITLTSDSRSVGALTSVPIVTLDGKGDAIKKLLPPQEIAQRDHYFTAFSWIEEEKAAAIWMRREQNYTVLSLCSQDKAWQCERHLQEKLGPDAVGWLEMFDPPLITSDKRHYLLRLPMNDPDSGAFRQIAMITINGRVKNFLTQGLHDVTKILAHRSDIRTVFYEATLVDRPGERHIFSIPDIHSSSPRNPNCLTCNQTTRNCSFHQAVFSPSAAYFVLQCLGPGVPWTEVRTAEDNQILMKTEVDKNVRSILEERAFPQFRSVRYPLDAANKFYAEINLILPPALREGEDVRFPLVVEILPSPGAQGVSKRLSVDWGVHLASQRDFIYARIDVRGSKNQGDKVLHETWHRLGSIEVEDYLRVVSYLTTSSDFHFVDPKRTAIWGWSYGGYVAASALAHERSAFNCAIAVAPITNWLFVDSFTSERYFGSPWSSGNFIRYEKSDLIHKAIHFREKNLFIIHGTADDSVHLQNSFAFMKSLNDAGVIYKSQIYPDSNHFLEDVKYHFYRSMETYLLDCFNLKEGHDFMEIHSNSRSAI